MSYNLVGNRQPVQQPQRQEQITAPEALQIIARDPASTMREAGFNVPNSLNGLRGQNGMQQVVQYLMQSGQAPQSRVLQLLQKFPFMRR